ncbi:DMT family transporter [Deefgea tanakiae]|uniref:DMT family transporter n=1 Tax=Deefgea tanakiae TaxID=2865840 RepID=A0ABX8Z6H6_9NEIS|nr:DMT family transporter [Deefgea tanakiae]QZA76770.1 DMT family transporter [Deefgea tanakiae]
MHNIISTFFGLIMNFANACRLTLLAAIWGASFLFLRLAVPSLGPIWTISARIGLAALFLAVVAQVLKQGFAWQHWREYLILGVFNTALPFLAYGFAARTLNASMMSILNATAPIWGAIIMALIIQKMPTFKVCLGLLIGVLGVAVLVGFDRIVGQAGAALGIAACLSATLCYGIASAYTKIKASHIPSFQAAHGSMWGASLFLLPLFAASQPISTPTPIVWFAIAGLAILCTGAAYLLYFRLVREIGAASTLTVTFLIPVFGILWGSLFLGEHIGGNTVMGALVILLGTALVTGFNPLANRK